MEIRGMDMKKYIEGIGKPAIAYMCTYMPEELVLASSLHPVRIIPEEKGTDRSSAFLQAYVCPVGKGMLNWGMDSLPRNLKGVVVPHSCDTIQKLSDIWRINHISGLHYDLVLPVDFTKQYAKDYTMKILEKLLEALGDVGKAATDESLRQAISLMNKVRQRIRSLNRKTMGARQFFEISISAMVMDKEEFLDYTEDIPLLETQGKPVIAVGNMMYDMDVFEMFDNVGLNIVDDDICPGTRYFEEDVDEDLPPLEAIATRIMKRPICPTKHAHTYREDYILGKVRKSSARGVVFLYQKFCEPHLFDYPHIKDALDKENIPSLFIEIEPSGGVSQQTYTRLEAFNEMLEN